MRKNLFLTAVCIVALSGRAEAANLAVITSPPTILNTLILLLACAAVAVCIRIMAAVKGGYLSKAWQVFVIGFVVLAISQIASLLQTFEVVALPGWVTPALMVLWAGIFFYGVFETKRILG